MTVGVILQIEDNLDDIDLFRLALAQSGSPCKVISVHDARDAIKYLARIGEYADKEKYPKPTLIVLDLSLPGMTGLEFLAWAKGEPPENIPSIVVALNFATRTQPAFVGKIGRKSLFREVAKSTGGERDNQKSFAVPTAVVIESHSIRSETLTMDINFL